MTPAESRLLSVCDWAEKELARLWAINDELACSPTDRDTPEEQ